MQVSESFERLNMEAFRFLNASYDASWFGVFLARQIANNVIYLFPLVLVALWLRGRPENRTGLVMAFLAAELGLFINQIIGLVYFHPRPFMIPVGSTFIYHAADNSFPSDHVTFMAAIAIGIWVLIGSPRISAILGALTLAAAWARIYLGVHFPFDMVAAPFVAIGAIIGVASCENWIEKVLMKKLLLPAYRKLFSYPIRAGWFEM